MITFLSEVEARNRADRGHRLLVAPGDMAILVLTGEPVDRFDIALAAGCTHVVQHDADQGWIAERIAWLARPPFEVVGLIEVQA